ncbi:MAG: glycosyltransferase 87 family protein, partial [Actinomycetota bacterium]|nr:glycosyltransferase 87 family protein [Actinomycetota bacterium]
MTAHLAWIFLAACAAAMVAAPLLRERVPVGASIAVGAVLRIAFAALTSRMFTPRDVTIYFHTTGQLILRGKDPVHDMPGRQWNFLELMPAIHALEIRSGLAWVYAVKMVPILADLVLIWLVARFAGKDSRSRALQYALNPVSLLVVSLHGQVEPVALALALTGILLIRKGRPVLGGLFLGAAVAAKTWPVIVLLAVLPLRTVPKLIRIVAGSAVVPLGCLLLGVIFLDTAPLKDLAHMASYT